MLKLTIANKNYSSWSMRPWVLMRQAGIAFEEVKLRFDSFAPDSGFKQGLRGVSPTGKVPVLQDGDLTVWDTLAIAEYLADKFPALALWPADPALRSLGRSACAEMHAGFGQLRQHFAMNIEARLPDVGALALRDHPGTRADLDRMVALWRGLLDRSGGPLLLGNFSVADAYFAPVCTRIVTYGLPVPDDIAGYVQRVLALPGVAAWVQDALAEADFCAFEEPYRLRR